MNIFFHVYTVGQYTLICLWLSLYDKQRKDRRGLHSWQWKAWHRNITHVMSSSELSICTWCISFLHKGQSADGGDNSASPISITTSQKYSSSSYEQTFQMRINDRTWKTCYTCAEYSSSRIDNLLAVLLKTLRRGGRRCGADIVSTTDLWTTGVVNLWIRTFLSEHSLELQLP